MTGPIRGFNGDQWLRQSLFLRGGALRLVTETQGFGGDVAYLRAGRKAKVYKATFKNRTVAMKVFLIGAAGGVGRRLAERLGRSGDLVSGMHRNPDQAEAVRATGATPVAGDLIDDPVDALAARISGHDAVVFSAGAHGTGMDKTTAIDGKGSHAFSIDVQDNGSPGRGRDRYRIQIPDVGYDSGDHVLGGGNVQIHEAGARTRGAGPVSRARSVRSPACQTCRAGGRDFNLHRRYLSQRAWRAYAIRVGAAGSLCLSIRTGKPVFGPPHSS